MNCNEGGQSPGEQLEELEVLSALDARELGALETIGDPDAQLRGIREQYRTLWLTVGLAAAITLGVVLIVWGYLHFLHQRMAPPEGTTGPGTDTVATTVPPVPADVAPAEVPVEDVPAILPEETGQVDAEPVPEDPARIARREEIQAQVRASKEAQIRDTYKWSFDLDDNQAGLYAAENNGVFILTGDGGKDREVIKVDRRGRELFRTRGVAPITGLDGETYLVRRPKRGPEPSAELLEVFDSSNRLHWSYRDDYIWGEIFVDPTGRNMYLLRKPGSGARDKWSLVKAGANGNTAWCFELEDYGEGICDPAFGENGKIYLSARRASGPFREVELNAITPAGEVAWVYKPGTRGIGRIVPLADGRIIAGLTDNLEHRGGLALLDRRGGEIWRIDLSNQFGKDCTILVNRDRIHVVENESAGYGETMRVATFDIDSGNRLWDMNVDSYVRMAPGPGGELYVISGSQLMRVNREGLVQWSAGVGRHETVYLRENGIIYVGYTYFQAFTRDGEVIKDDRPRLHSPRRGMISEDGTYVFVSSEGDVYAYEH